MTKKIILSATIYLCLILKISCLKVFIKSVDGQRNLSGHTNSVRSLAFLPYKNILVTGSADSTIKLWNFADGSLIRNLIGHTSIVEDLLILPNSNIASASYDSTVRIWSSDTGSLLFTLRNHTNSATSLALLDNGNIVSGSKDATVKEWDPRNGTLVRTYFGHTSAVWDLAKYFDNQFLSASSDFTIKRWCSLSGTIIQTLIGHTSFILSLTVLPDGLIASGSTDKNVLIWNINLGTYVKNLTGHTNTVLGLTVAPEGYLVSSSWDNTIKFWDPYTGELMYSFVAHTDLIRSVMFTTSGNLISGSNDRLAKHWNVIYGSSVDFSKAGLIYYWPFDNSINDTTELTNEENSKNYKFVKDRLGKDNSAIEFSKGFVRLANFQMPVSEFTLTLWANFKAKGLNARIIDTGNGPDKDNIAFHLLNRTSRVSFTVFNNRDNCQIFIPYELDLNRWYHLAFVFNNKGVGFIYVNGVLETANTCGVRPRNNITRNRSFIGKSNWNEHSLAEAIYDEIKIYNRPLSSPEIEAEFNTI